MTEPFDVKVGARLLEMARSASVSEGTMVRVELPVSDIEPLSWLKASAQEPKTYWRNREGTIELAGVGVAWETVGHDMTSFGAALEHAGGLLVAAPAGLKCFAAMRFDPGATPDEEWRPYGCYRFWIPRFEVLRREDTLFVACNRFPGSFDGASLPADLFSPPSQLAPAEFQPPKMVVREDNPDHEHWDAVIRDALASISSGRLEKAVLARETRFAFANSVNPFDLLDKLKEQHSDNFLFGLQLDGQRAFVGAPPERLYRREGRLVQSEAVAGTRPRGATRQEDDEYAATLMASAKDRREHSFVERNIEAALGALCETTTADESVSIMKLPHCQHLVRRYQGVLKAGRTDGDLLQLLHPTPAVGGVPTEAATRFLHDHEPFDRGWYAGPVGWLSADSAEFAVAIRSARIDGDRLSLYSGAGVVRESVSELEWNEVETKIRAFLDALSIR